MDALWQHSMSTRRGRASHRHRRDISTSEPGRRGVPRRHAARHRQARARHGHARAVREACSSRLGDQARQSCSRSKCSSCTPRTPTWAHTWSACGACRTPSPRRSPITRILRSRRTQVRPCRASCTCADRLAHRPDIADVRSPELGLNLDYLEAQATRGSLERVARGLCRWLHKKLRLNKGTFYGQEQTTAGR